jgi:two-component system, chemotaxis family, chemotaxis protein CheY
MMKILIVEDDFTSRLLLQTILSAYGECHIAVNGKEAIDAFALALEEGKPYQLICLDVMMPEVDGMEALKKIRSLEEEMGINSSAGVKIIMTTALGDPKNVIGAFKSLCDAYLVKPVNKSKLLDYLRSFGLIT